MQQINSDGHTSFLLSCFSCLYYAIYVYLTREDWLNIRAILPHHHTVNSHNYKEFTLLSADAE